MASRRQPRPKKKRKKRIVRPRARAVRPPVKKRVTFTQRASKAKKAATKTVKKSVKKTTARPSKKRSTVKPKRLPKKPVKPKSAAKRLPKKPVRKVKRATQRPKKRATAKKIDTRIRRPRKPKQVTRVATPKKRKVRARKPAPPPPKERRPVRRPTSRRPKTRPKVASTKKRSIRPTGKQQAAITRARLRFLASRPPTTPGRQEIYDRNRAALIQSLLNAGYSPASVRARVGWITRLRGTVRVRVAQARIAALGTARLTGRTREDWYTLRAMIEERDDRYARFLAAAKREGLSLEQAKDEWFSPDMLE